MASCAASSRPQSSWLRRLILLAIAGSACSALPAAAAPWVQDKGAIYARASAAFEVHESYDALREDAYIEWGATERWTLSAKYETVDFETSDSFDSDGWRVSAKRSLWRSGGWSSVVEFGALEGAAIGGFRGCESVGAEIGAGIGYSIEGSLGKTYIGSVLSNRTHENDCYHNRMEAVLGLKRADGWIWTAQLWSERGDGDRSDKYELALSREFGMFEVGLGARREIGGEFHETAMVVSVAIRP